VVRHDQVRVGREEQARAVDAALGETVHLGEKRLGIDNDAVADDGGAARRDDPGRHQVQGVVLTVGGDDRMAGVVAALVAHHVVDLSAEDVGGLALALVAPLGADEHDRRHDEPS